MSIKVSGLFFLLCVSCASNPYLGGSANTFKRERLPFPTYIQFKVSQGAFGKASHLEKANEYSWDFDVPYGTPVVSVENGKIIEVWQPNKGGGCDPQFEGLAHNIKVEHEDGTVAQYVHIASKLKRGDYVREGQQIAVTAMNGHICQPQLHFGIYRSKDHLYSSLQRETLPVYFDGLGKAIEGASGEVPAGLQIEVVKETSDTPKTVQLVKDLVQKFDLSPYFFTRKIQIEKFVIPHDYPVLTLNPSHNDEPDFLLSTFLHEELHRFLSGPNEQKTQAVIRKLREKFAHVAVGGQAGASDEASSYLHLVVCWFELQADKKYLGNDRAYEVIRSTKHYTWIYEHVLSYEKYIGDLIARNGLSFEPAVEVFASNFTEVTADIQKFDKGLLKMKKAHHNSVKDKLKQMYEIDQYTRDYFMNLPFTKKYSPAQTKEFQKIFVSRMASVDRANTIELKEILTKRDWIKISEFGKQADKQAWIIVQHADLDIDFQKHILSILTGLVKTHVTDAADYAYLVDRVASSFGDPTQRTLQKFGTQGSCVGPGEWQPLESEDPANLDQRRHDVGLPPEAEYIKIFKDICH